MTCSQASWRKRFPWRARKTFCTPRRKDSTIGDQKRPEKKDFIKNRMFRPHRLPQQKIKSFFLRSFLVAKDGISTMQTRISTSSRSSSLSALGRKVWLTFRRSLTHETESEQTRHFCSLYARLQHCLFDDRRMKIESPILSSPGKELTGNSTVGAEQFHVLWMIDVFKKLQKRKKGTYSKGEGV